MSPKKTQIDRAVESIEREIAGVKAHAAARVEALESAIASLRQQTRKTPTRRDA